MTTYRRNAGDGLSALFKGRHVSRGAAWGIMIIGALLAFEVFNFSTTEFALNDVLGELKFAGLRWATILSIAFCGIDFAGIARIFTPEQGAGRTGRSLVSLRRLAVGCCYECYAHLVGRFHCYYQPQ